MVQHTFKTTFGLLLYNQAMATVTQTPKIQTTEDILAYTKERHRSVGVTLDEITEAGINYPTFASHKAAFVQQLCSDISNELQDGATALGYANAAVLAIALAHTFSPTYAIHLAENFGFNFELYSSNTL